MNPDWLTQLAPAHAPAAAGWWPPAPGWWVLGVVLVASVVLIVKTLRDPRRALRQAALRQLRIIKVSDADGAAVARATQNLLRRYALAVFGHSTVAKLTGEAWLKFVVDAGGAALAGAPGRSLLAAAFGNVGAADNRDQWTAGAESFIKCAARAGGPRRSARAGSPALRPAGGSTHAGGSPP